VLFRYRGERRSTLCRENRKKIEKTRCGLKNEVEPSSGRKWFAAYFEKVGGGQASY